MTGESSDLVNATTLSSTAGADLSKITSAANVSKPQTADGGDGILAGFVVDNGMLMRVTYV